MFKKYTSGLSFFLGLYFIAVAIYAVFSYSLTDPNLVILKWKPFWAFQQWMWLTFFHNPPLQTVTYAAIIVVLFFIYWKIIRTLEASSLEYQVSTKQKIVVYLLVLAPLFISYNALSHDVFNYMFNAKMVLEFGVNPHQRVALDFAYDPWTRFMHNTHTPAPYGYGWTAISLLPYLLGAGKFLFTWLSFRMWSLVSILLLYVVLERAGKVFLQRKLLTHELALVFLNPLFVIELLGNMHNDLWMMVPAVFALTLVAKLSPVKYKQLFSLSLAIVLFAFSISIKWATVALIPVFGIVLFIKFYLFKFSTGWQSKLPVLKALPTTIFSFIESKLYGYLPLFASILLFLPLLTSRSQYFLPWYLTWSLVWLPLISLKLWKNIILLFSVTAMLRYIPWLWTGTFDGNVVSYQRAITFLPVFMVLLWQVYRQMISTKAVVRK